MGLERRNHRSRTRKENTISRRCDNDTRKSELEPGMIVGLEIRDRGLVWVGLDVLTIRWEVETVPVDEHGSTASMNGFVLERPGGRTEFIPSYKVMRIIRAKRDESSGGETSGEGSSRGE